MLRQGDSWEMNASNTHNYQDLLKRASHKIARP